jgi:hypothetical protein
VGGAAGPNLGGGEQFDSFQGSDGPSLRNNGDTVFVASLFTLSSGVTSNNNYGVWRNSGGANHVLAREGDAGSLGPNLGAGVAFGDFSGYAASNDSGDVAYNAYLRGTNVGSNNNRGIFVYRNGATAALARTGSSGSLGPGLEAGVQFTSLIWPVINTAGDVFFVGNVTGAPSNARPGIWRNRGGQNTVFALAGAVDSLGPGIGPDISFRTFQTPECNAVGDAIFGAYLSGPGVTSSNEYGIWAFIQNQLFPIAREGDQFDVDPSSAVDLRTISGVFLGSVSGGSIPSGGDDGRIRTLNDSGVVVFQLSFTDGSAGIFTTYVVPEPNSLTIVYAVAAIFLATLRSKASPSTA